MLFRTMQVSPQTVEEKWFVALVNLLGSALNAVIFGEVRQWPGTMAGFRVPHVHPHLSGGASHFYFECALQPPSPANEGC